MSVTNVENVAVLDMMVNIDRLVVDVMGHLKIMVLEDLVEDRDIRVAQKIVMSLLVIKDIKDANDEDHQGLLEITKDAIIMDHEITTTIIVVMDMTIMVVTGLDLIITLMEMDVAGITTSTGGALVLGLILQEEMTAIVDQAPMINQEDVLGETANNAEVDVVVKKIRKTKYPIEINVGDEKVTNVGGKIRTRTRLKMLY